MGDTNGHIYWGIAIYLAPAVFAAAVMRLASRYIYLFALLTLSGTFCHEVLHLIVGQLTGAKPTSIDLFPKRLPNGQIQLGSVSFNNLRWYNAAPTCLAPLLGLPIVVWIAWLNVKDGWEFSTKDLVAWSFIAPLVLSFWPSSTDFRLSIRSWPYLAVTIFLAWWYWIPSL